MTSTRAGGQPDGVGQSLLLDLEELADGTVRAGDLGQRSRVLGVVEMEEVDAVEAERLQALLEGAARLGGVEAPFSSSRSSLVERTKPGGSPPRSRMTSPIRSSLRPKP